MMEMAGPTARGSFLDESLNESIVRKWSDMEVKGGRVNFLKGLDTNRAKVTAICLENQAKYLKEDTLSTNTGSFQKYIFPVVRKLFPNLILNDIATVQPLTGPYGAMFTMGYNYDDRKGAKLPWGGISNQPYEMAYQGAVAAGDEAIKNFGKNYGNEYVDYDAICTDTGAAPATLSNTDANCRVPKWMPIRAPGTAGQRTFTVKAMYRVTDAAVPVVGAYNVIATKNATTTALVDQYTHAVGTLDIATGAWTINALLIAGGASTFVANTIIYLQYWYNSELVYTVTGGRVPRMSLGLTRHDIQAERQAISTTWSIDAAQDLRAQHGMDLEAEMVSTLANELALEIDRNGIDQMIAQAAHTATYTYAGTFPGDMEKIHEFSTYIDALSARISRTGGRGPANFIVAGPEASSLLCQLGAHADWRDNVAMQQAATHGDRNTSYAIKRVGTINGKYTLYENPFQDSTKVLIGYKGTSWLDAGFGYAPYIPLFATDTWTNPDTFMASKGLASWYALKMLRSEYYGVLTIGGLPTVTSILV
jgi:hypothetical protein